MKLMNVQLAGHSLSGRRKRRAGVCHGALAWAEYQCQSWCGDFRLKPGAGVSPVTFRCRQRDAEDVGGLLNRQADKKPEFHQFRLLFVLRGEFFQGFVDGQKLLVTCARGNVLFQNVHALLSAAVTQGEFAAGIVNEDAAHGFGGGGEKVGATVPLDIFPAGEPQPRLMDERGGLQRLVRRFVGHLVGGELAQFFIDQRQQFIGGFGVAVFDGLQNLGDVAHDCGQSIFERLRLFRNRFFFFPTRRPFAIGL